MENIKNKYEICLIEEAMKEAKRTGNLNPIIMISCPCLKCSIKR